MKKHLLITLCRIIWLITALPVGMISFVVVISAMTTALIGSGLMWITGFNPSCVEIVIISMNLTERMCQKWMLLLDD